MALILALVNKSKLAPVSDYRYQVLVGDGGPDSKVIATGVIKAHTRSDGWKALIQRVLDEQ